MDFCVDIQTDFYVDTRKDFYDYKLMVTCVDMWTDFVYF